MFVDASVIVAILGREPDRLDLIERLERHRDGFFVSPLVRYEAAQALARKKIAQPHGKSAPRKPTREEVELAGQAVQSFILGLGAEEVAITSEIGTLAVAASARYGKAVGHPADLNLGDCFAYARAKTLGVPLAYKGGDFALTDLA